MSSNSTPEFIEVSPPKETLHLIWPTEIQLGGRVKKQDVPGRWTLLGRDESFSDNPLNPGFVHRPDGFDFTYDNPQRDRGMTQKYDVKFEKPGKYRLKLSYRPEDSDYAVSNSWNVICYEEANIPNLDFDEILRIVETVLLLYSLGKIGRQVMDRIKEKIKEHKMKDQIYKQTSLDNFGEDNK